MAKYILCEDATLIRSTDKAGLYRIDGEEHWIPWSQIRDGSVDKDGETGDLWITEWIANEKEFEWEDEANESSIQNHEATSFAVQDHRAAILVSNLCC